MWMQVLKALVCATIFGVLTVLVGYFSGFVMNQMKNSKLPEECADWNKNFIMEKSLFLTGFLTWLIALGFALWMNPQTAGML